MTTKDNQNFRISISMTTQTPAGIDWKGEVEVSGPYDDAMLDQVVALSDQLAEKAMEQRAISSRLKEASDAIESLPARPRKKRSKLDQVIEECFMDAGAQVIKDAEADFLAQAVPLSDLKEVGSTQTLGDYELIDDNDIDGFSPW